MCISIIIWCMYYIAYYTENDIDEKRLQKRNEYKNPI